ncbi:hypothetical protein ABEB36_015452 [Hypothenemus hampei]|uniref:Uncharacterized protein n=1 Tax=Hypothenemus hampei TaxID=57062 RepID=A0ABD1E0J0_HYPHA
MSEYSDEIDPYHDSNSDRDPDYLSENDSFISAASRSSLVNIAIPEHIITSSDSEEDHPEENVLSVKMTKKRKRTPHKWKRNVRKYERNSSMQYTNSENRVIEAKKQGLRCQCRNECFDKFTEIERDNIVGNYSQILH